MYRVTSSDIRKRSVFACDRGIRLTGAGNEQPWLPHTGLHEGGW